MPAPVPRGEQPHQKWFLLDFSADAPRGLLLPVRWRGGDEPRPSSLPYDVATRELSALVDTELDALIDSLVHSNAPRLRGIWTDALGVEVDGHEGDVVIRWREGQPSMKDVAFLRRFHAPFADTSLAELRTRMAGSARFSFRMEFFTAREEARLVSELESAGFDCVVVGAGSWELAWPPAHVAVQRYADMWRPPHRYVLEEHDDGRRPNILDANTGGFCLIEEGEDFLDELTRCMRAAGVPTVRADRRPR